MATGSLGIVALTAPRAPKWPLVRGQPTRPHSAPATSMGELGRLRFGSAAHISLHDGAASQLRGRDPVITVSRQKGVVLQLKADEVQAQAESI